MKRRQFLSNSGMLLAAGSITSMVSCSSNEKPALGKRQIQHGVIFSLKYEVGSELALKFLDDGRNILSGIPVVQQFQVFRQISEKNRFQYGFTMVFDSQEDYQTYNAHPDHVTFVEERWKKEVDQFMEIDFEAI